ncbi:MAG: DUF2235 domain-containing protein [Rhodobacteraceae bacterium]|nr:DUF2235 domain-containing protein [Paracoccaceae bacterium]
MTRKPKTHVVIMDGTLSSLGDGLESNAGLTYRLLTENGPRADLSVIYEEGIQWCTWGSFLDVIAGRGLTRQIQRAYGHVASSYLPGDRIFLFGFSRGAFAVRSLAGVIDRMGLLRRDAATERNVRQVFRYYRGDPDSISAKVFSRTFCNRKAQVEMIGVWDTVKALGIQYPLLWRLAPQPTEFHDHNLGAAIKAGFQALALDENRVAFQPVLWQSDPDWQGKLEQVWFRGAHSDIGGHIGHFQAARPLSNIPLVWMLDRAEACGLNLPKGWKARFPTDPKAPSVGAWSGIARLFLFRKRRIPLRDPSESIHSSVRPDNPGSNKIGLAEPASAR